ncbi:MAG TPA: hypothetical protein VMW13_06110 [Dehalococcoidales bacterium]|nr:hypothetical protein [Dehalococcoidales bacterium]
MSDILDEAHGIAQCRSCPWYRSCATPMKLTVEDIRRQLESTTAGMGTQPSEDIGGIQNLLGGMATAAQNSILEGCPVFIQRLRASPELARRIKEMMQNWAQQDGEQRDQG